MTLAAVLGSLIGAILAFTGAGGGILAVPALIFGMHLPMLQAAPTALLAVGTSAAVGAVLGLHEGVVRYRAAMLIGALGMVTAPLGVVLAHWLPNRPLLAGFAVLMIVLGVRALRGATGAASGALATAVTARACRIDPLSGRLQWTAPCARALAGTGVISGLLSGLLGVGGGFVIVPALNRHTDLELRSVQATSLAVIALVSVSGITASAWSGALAWPVAGPFAAGATLALVAGRRLARRIPVHHLHRAFAWLILAVAGLMLARAAGWF
jgi:uncharacterized membrane protein YfcA